MRETTKQSYRNEMKRKEKKKDRMELCNRYMNAFNNKCASIKSWLATKNNNTHTHIHMYTQILSISRIYEKPVDLSDEPKARNSLARVVNISLCVCLCACICWYHIRSALHTRPPVILLQIIAFHLFDMAIHDADINHFAIWPNAKRTNMIVVAVDAATAVAAAHISSVTVPIYISYRWFSIDGMDTMSIQRRWWKRERVLKIMRAEKEFSIFFFRCGWFRFSTIMLHIYRNKTYKEREKFIQGSTKPHNN